MYGGFMKEFLFIVTCLAMGLLVVEIVKAVSNNYEAEHQKDVNYIVDRPETSWYIDPITKDSTLIWNSDSTVVERFNDN